MKLISVRHRLRLRLVHRPSADFHADSLNAGLLMICLMTAFIKPGKRASNSARRSES